MIDSVPSAAFDFREVQIVKAAAAAHAEKEAQRMAVHLSAKSTGQAVPKSPASPAARGEIRLSTSKSWRNVRRMRAIRSS